LTSEINLPVLSKLAQRIIRRAAQLVGCQAAGVADFKKEISGNSSLVMVMDGSVFWKGHQFSEIVQQTVSNLTDIPVSFPQIDNPGVIGGAILISP